MDWHRWSLLLLQLSFLDFGKNAAEFAQLTEKRLFFLQHSKCTYSYEVAVHTARGSKSTESDGYQLHALVRITLIASCLSEIQLLFFMKHEAQTLFQAQFFITNRFSCCRLQIRVDAETPDQPSIRIIYCLVTDHAQTELSYNVL